MMLTGEIQSIQPSSTQQTERVIRFYRLIHSSGELVFKNLTDACAAMRERPGARVFAGFYRKG